MAQFLSDEWIKTLKNEINSNKEYRDIAKAWEGDFLFIVTPDEDLKEELIFYVDLWHGKCRDASLVTGTKNAAYVLKGPYSSWKKVIGKEVDPIRALILGMFTLRGDSKSLMSNARAAQELVNMVANIPTNFNRNVVTWRFMSPKIIFGRNAIEHLRTLNGKKACIITGKTICQMGFVEKALIYLKEKGIETLIFDEVEPNPSIETIKKGAQTLRKFCPDWIIGFGGGSSIDAGKAMWVLYERDDVSLFDINPYTKLDLRAKARFIAIPTTSGSGSESTWAVAITNTQNLRKIILASEELIPDIAIVDPFFSSQMPLQLTVQTGIDALTHTIEAYVSQWSNEFSDALAIKAMQLIFYYLPRVYNNTNDLEAREKMHYAATMAGMALGNSQVGLAHSMGHAFGSFFEVPHGRAVGVFLPYVVEYNGKVVQPKYSEIVTMLNLERNHDTDFASNLAGRLRTFIKELNEPTSIKDMDIDKMRFKSNLETLINYTIEDASSLGNPRLLKKEEIKKLYMYAWEGKSIDF